MRARELRAEAWSVKQIAQYLGVSKSSVSLWVRDVELADAQRESLAARIRAGPLESGARSRERGLRRRAAFQEEGRRLARERDSSYAAGCMLYWGEGSKGRGAVRLSNSDPAMIAFFARFLREHFGVEDDAISLYCNLFADHLDRQREIEAFWLRVAGPPPSCLRKSSVNVQSKYSQKKRANKLPYGTCRLVVHSTRIVQTIYGSIQEYGGFERPGWLD